MNELKCKECGAALEQASKECPSCGRPVEEVKTEPAAPACGCPIEETAAEPAAPAKTQARSAKKFNIMSVVSLLLGVAIIIMGITVMTKKVNIDTYSAKFYDAEYRAFGADFYTDIYEASDIIVDELNDINGGIEVLSESMAAMANTVYYPVGMMIIALGLGVVAVSCNHIKKENP